MANIPQRVCTHSLTHLLTHSQAPHIASSEHDPVRVFDLETSVFDATHEEHFQELSAESDNDAAAQFDEERLLMDKTPGSAKFALLQVNCTCTGVETDAKRESHDDPMDKSCFY